MAGPAICLVRTRGSPHARIVLWKVESAAPVFEFLTSYNPRWVLNGSRQYLAGLAVAVGRRPSGLSFVLCPPLSVVVAVVVSCWAASPTVPLSHPPFSLYWRKQSLSTCIVILLAIHIYNTHVVARTDLTLFIASFLREYYTLAWQKTVRSLTRMLFPEKILMGVLVVCLGTR